METSVFRPRRRPAMPALLLSFLAQAPAFAADGTIRFVGAIVAAPYEISPQRVPTMPVAPRGRATQSTGELVFERQWIDRPSASVAVLPVGAQAFDMAYVDSLGHRQGVEANGSLPIGRDGGRLSLARRPAGQGNHLAAAALLTVTYD